MFVAPGSIASVNFNSGTTFPRLVRDDFLPGAYGRVVVQLECTSASPIGLVRLAMSVDLVGHYA